ncbi:MAG: asparagine synthase C-terminal domain-containing protein [Candidatus Thorarchaeota archaeon SMTZ1-83]|nr:MAG: hypothetical protein AM324_12705 [Candidatus Thorarchaeota archaeon SMTZ1-83]
MIDRNALEIVLQMGGEMFGRTVFGTEHLTPEIPKLSNEIASEPTQLDNAELSLLSDLLFEAVTDSMSAFENKKIGLALSGGVDSSLLLYLLRQCCKNADVVAYHSDWNYPPKSELEFAKLAAEFTDVPLKIVDVSPDKQIPHLDEALSRTKTISYTTVPVYMVFKKMADDGIDVAVNALGLDELFAGYTFHRSYYERRRFRFVPYSAFLLKYRIVQAAARRYGSDKAWFLAHVAPHYATRLVKDSHVDIARLYEENLKASTMWTSMHNFLLDAMAYNWGNLIARPAHANGLEIIFPYLHNGLIGKCLEYHPLAKINKAPVRELMRSRYNFPEEIARRGETWDKVGWGGTGTPYFQDASYMQAIDPDPTVAKEWFTDHGVRKLSELPTKPTVLALKMALFLRTAEIV